MKRKIISILNVFMILGLTLSYIPADAVFASGSKIAADYSMDLSDYSGKWVYQEDSKCYALTGVVYCSKPVDTKYESMNIYVPAVYMNADGTLTHTVFNGYTAETAPIIYANGVGGYSQATPRPLDKDSRNFSSFYTYLAKGYIVVSVGSRGKETQAGDGAYIGKSPAGIVDLKAGVRFLKYNDKHLAGSSKRIISVGGSAGGAMSALLGATGNNFDYNPYLEEIGAVMTTGDDIYGAMCYCPIIDLENSDVAYEWMFGGKDTTHYTFFGNTSTLNELQQVLSTDMAALFPSYLNGLGLKDKAGNALKLDARRSGAYYRYLMDEIDEALNTFLAKNYKDTTKIEEYITSLNGTEDWVVWNGRRACITGLDPFVKYYQGRIKGVPADDGFDYTSSGMPAQNQLFGDKDKNLEHFGPLVAQLLRDNDNRYSLLDGYQKNYVSDYSVTLTDKALINRVHLMNPMNYITDKDEKEACDTAPFFRIRVGTQDAHESFSVGMNLAIALDTYEKTDVDYALIWNQGHGEADYEGDFVAWIERICQN